MGEMSYVKVGEGEPHASQPILCLGCASVYDDPETDELVCPECGYAISRDRYERVASYAADAAKYGHQYRKRYEKQGTSKVYSLKPDEVLRFAAIAVLSGVTYDLVKLAVRKIVHSCESQGIEGHENISDSEQLEEFMANVRSFKERMPDVADDVRAECLKEMYIDAYAQATAPLYLEVLLNGGELPDHETVKKALLAAHSEVASRQPPAETDFVDCWVRLGIMEDED